MVFNLLSQHDLDKSQLKFQYKEGVCSIVMKNIREPIMCIMVSEDDLYKMTYSDAEYLCNHLDTPSLVAHLPQQDMTHYAVCKHDDIKYPQTRKVNPYVSGHYKVCCQTWTSEGSGQIPTQPQSTTLL